MPSSESAKPKSTGGRTRRARADPGSAADAASVAGLVARGGPAASRRGGVRRAASRRGGARRAASCRGGSPRRVLSRRGSPWSRLIAAGRQARRTAGIERRTPGAAKRRTAAGIAHRLDVLLLEAAKRRGASRGSRSRATFNPIAPAAASHASLDLWGYIAGQRRTGRRFRRLCGVDGVCRRQRRTCGRSARGDPR